MCPLSSPSTHFQVEKSLAEEEMHHQQWLPDHLSQHGRATSSLCSAPAWELLPVPAVSTEPDTAPHRGGFLGLLRALMPAARPAGLPWCGRSSIETQVSATPESFRQTQEVLVCLCALAQGPDSKHGVAVGKEKVHVAISCMDPESGAEDKAPGTGQICLQSQAAHITAAPQPSDASSFCL